MSDEAIAARVQKGDAELFGLLMERYEHKLVRYARKFLWDEDDTKDLVQEVFIKAYVNIRSFNPARRFSPWIYRIAHNQFINALKKKGRRRETLLSAFDPDLLFPHFISKDTADAAASRNELRRTLDTYLNQISTKYREPLVLYYFEEMDYREIADILHLPVATVGVRLKRGRELLKKMLGEAATYRTHTPKVDKRDLSLPSPLRRRGGRQSDFGM